MDYLKNRYKKAANDCWEWLLYTTKDGYGRLRSNGILYDAHRASYLQYKGEIPTGLYVLHTCDNRKCVNPKHLYLGTHKQNMKDRMLRERTYNQRFTHETKATITLLYKEGLNQTELAKRFNTTQGHISKLIKSYQTNTAIM